MKVYRISAITLKVKDMEKSQEFYSRIPGFRLVYGGRPSDSFATFEAGEGSKTYLNLELTEKTRVHENRDQLHTSSPERKMQETQDFGRVIFHTENVDRLYSHMKNDRYISESAVFETEPTDAPWGERFFHIRDLNGYQISFAQPLR